MKQMLGQKDRRAAGMTRPGPRLGAVEGDSYKCNVVLR